jgi:CDP-diacylglycerol--glycerol-3-phosphate 3-phosphatidyltransferase
VRVSYLQPAELRPGLLTAIATTPGVAPYFDLSFQHASPTVLRRMRRFGGTSDFLALIDRIRALAPAAGIRSNVIVGFPGETEADVDELAAFLEAARLDVVGVFGYSDEDGTEAAGLPDKLSADVVAARVARITDLAEELTAQRAEERVGETVTVLVEGPDEDDPSVTVGRAAHQGPEVDGRTLLPGVVLAPGSWVTATVVGSAGVDLIAEPAPRPSNWNVANALTLLRIAIVPVFIALLARDHGETTSWRLAATAAFMLAVATDRIDGELARKHGLITDLGKIADPIADKALIGAALIVLSALGELWWWVTIVVLVREVGITLMRFWVIRYGVIPAGRGGKWKTAAQALALTLYVAPLPSWLHWTAIVVMAVAVALTVYSAGDYIAQAVRLRRTGGRAVASPIAGTDGVRS